VPEITRFFSDLKARRQFSRRSERARIEIRIGRLWSAALERAEAAGLSVPDYVEALLQADHSAEEELESLALAGLNSGTPIEAGPGYWEEKHRRLDERLKKTGTR
jgi:hypothetical protein